MPLVTKIYIGVLAVAFAIATLLGTYDRIPPWLIWILGIIFALGLLSAGLTIFGARLLRRAQKGSKGHR